MRHVIEWPGGEWHTQKQALKALGISARMFERLQKRGILSAGYGDEPRVHLWHWSELYAVSVLWPQLVKVIELEEEDAPQSSEKPKK